MTNRLASALNFRPGELSLGLLAACFYFCVLCGYFFLRPVREAMGVSGGMGALYWYFLSTSVASLVVVLLFGGVVSRLDRRRFIPIGYSFVIVCLIGFAALLVVDASAGGGLIGSDLETGLARGVGYTFFIWLSVINLFVNSLFWAFMVDIFNVDQGKRMFAFIGIGGTLGAIVGSWAASFISGLTESIYLPAGFMLIGASCFGLAIVVMLTLDKVAIGSAHSRLTGGGTVLTAKIGERIGGNFWDGATAVARSPYLLGIGAFIVLMAISNTLIYFAVAQGMLDNTDTFSQRVEGFAQFDLLAQIATLITQMFITTHLIKRFGVGWTLTLLPLVTVAGFVVLAIWPLYGVVAIFQALHRATRYAISRPARETLFSVVPPAEKYKAKPLVDVFLYRGGDVAGAGIDSALRALGLSVTWVAAAAVPLAMVWGALSIALGHAQQRRDIADETTSALTQTS
jgi:AAA family ATP:ADP antiporter